MLNHADSSDGDDVDDDAADLPPGYGILLDLSAAFPSIFSDEKGKKKSPRKWRFSEMTGMIIQRKEGN